MANEITTTFSLNVTNGTFIDAVPQIAESITQSAVGQTGGVTSVPTSDTALSLTGVTTLGVMVLQNLDASNFVTFGPDNGAGMMVNFCKLKAGEFAKIRLLPGILFRWKADTSAVKVQWKLLND